MRRAFSALVLGLTLAAGSAMALPEIIYDPDDPSRQLASNEYPAVIDKLIRRRDFARAERMLEIGLRENPLSAQMRFQRCVLFERSDRLEEARGCLEAFIKRYPEIPEPYNNLAALYSGEGRLDRAEELLKRALALKPDFAMAYANLGNLYLARAKNAYVNSLAHRPGDERTQQKLRRLEPLLK